jgi:dUTPase
MNFLVNEIIAQMDKEAVVAKVKPRSSSSLRERIVMLHHFCH